MKHEQLIANIKKTIHEVRGLPTLPSVAVEALRLTNDPHVSISTIVEIVEKDVALAGRILKAANSAYYGVPQQVDNLRMAIVMLGVLELSKLVTTVSILRMFPAKNSGMNFTYGDFWKHCASTAELTTALYDIRGVSKPRGAYIAGLLHDIGKIFLDQYYHDLFLACLKHSNDLEVPFTEAELELIGADHGQIGSWLLERWNMPKDIISAVSNHHIRREKLPPNSMADFVDWADRLYYVMENNSRLKAVETLRNDPQWNEWHRDRGKPTDLLVESCYNRVEQSMELISILS